ncbi:MAG TPA: metallophosphoesterase family protein [Rhizomicrobium sp.]
MPEGLRVYAVGDIHGCLAELNALLAKIEDDAAGYAGKRQIVFLGDYVDRGPDSRGVIERILGLHDRSQARAIRGNHDQFLLDFLDEPMLFRQWRDYGGRETLVSYGVSPPLFDDEKAFAAARDAFRDALPPRHLAFLRGLDYAIEIGGFYFVHAGVRPGIALAQQARADLLSIRDDFLLSDSDFGRVVVHGHTPTEGPVRRANRIGVDTGAYATGRLTAAVLEGTSCRFLST